jgi:hypothetical protein
LQRLRQLRGTVVDVGAGPIRYVQELQAAMQAGTLRYIAVEPDLAALRARVDAMRAAGWHVVEADPAWPEGVREYPLLALQEAGLHALYGARLAAERAAIDPVLVAQI